MITSKSKQRTPSWGASAAHASVRARSRAGRPEEVRAGGALRRWTAGTGDLLRAAAGSGGLAAGGEQQRESRNAIPSRGRTDEAALSLRLVAELGRLLDGDGLGEWEG